MYFSSMQCLVKAKKWRKEAKRVRKKGERKERGRRRKQGGKGSRKEEETGDMGRKRRVGEISVVRCQGEG